MISGTSVSHSDATVDEIEAACAPDERTRVTNLLDNPAVEEAFALQTCNRAEAYVVTTEPEAGRAALDAAFDGLDAVRRDLGHEASLRHLMRVACGLESLVLGEDQIIGQVRAAYERAREAGGIGPTLDDALLKALHVGERARTETQINEGVVSLGSAAVELAARERDLTGATGLVIGAGEMGTLAATALSSAVAKVVVANRTRDRAAHVAATLKGEAEAVTLAELPAAVADAHVVVTATNASDPVINAATLAAAGETLVVDLAQPHDVAADAAALSNVTVRDLDDLESVTDETRTAREAAARRVETMIDTELDHLMAQFKRKRAEGVISAMY